MLAVSAIVICDLFALFDVLDGSDPDLAIASEVTTVRCATVIDELGVATSFSVNAPVLVQHEHVKGTLLGFVSAHALGSRDLFATVFD
jgi:hypothetical protein